MFFQVLKLKTGMPEYSDFVHFSAAAVESDLWGPGRPYTDSEPSKNGGSKITDVNFASQWDARSSLFFIYVLANILKIAILIFFLLGTSPVTDAKSTALSHVVIKNSISLKIKKKQTDSQSLWDNPIHTVLFAILFSSLLSLSKLLSFYHIEHNGWIIVTKS